MATVDKDFKVKNSVTAGIGYRVRSTANPVAPTVALAGLGAGNVDNGTHYYFVTYVTANGETNLSSGASVTVADKTVNGQVTVTIPTSSDTRVTARKIYRNTANSNSWVEVKLLATINDNTTTTYTDNIADASTSWPPTGANTSYYYKDNTTTKPLKDETGNYPLLHATAMNTAVGRNSLATIVAGTSVGGSNNAFGKDTLYSLTTGAQNNVFGTGSGALITTGNDNVLMGHTAGAGLTTGNYNIFLGRNTGYGVATSGHNVFIGYYAGYGPGTTNQNPASNIAIGSSSLQNITTANNNVAIGFLSGYNVTTGGTNTALGTYALYTNSTGTGNVAVGYYAGAYETGTGYFYVNNQDRTNLAGDQTKSLLYGTFNATASSQQLTVNGTLNATYPLVGADTTDSSSTVTGAFKTAGGMGIAKTLYVGTGANIAGGKTTLAATTTGYASLNLPHGTAPSAPVDGDFWTTTVGAYVRVNGVTVGPLASSAGAGVAWGAITGTLSSQTDLQTALDAKLNLSGGTLTGDLTIGKASPSLLLNATSGSPSVNISGVAGTFRGLQFKTAGTRRWTMYANADAESGSDVGSDFAMYRANDAGSETRVMYIQRSTGNVTFDNAVTLSGDLTIGKASPVFTVSASSGNAYHVISAAASATAGTIFRSAGSTRWVVGKNETPDSSTATGSDFVVRAYDNNAALLSTPLTITRSTGLFTFTGDMTLSKTTPTLQATSGTGTATIRASSGDGHSQLLLDSPAGLGAARVVLRTGTSWRWNIGKNWDAESGANAGSNFAIQAYADDGATLIATPLTITRSTGNATFTGDLTVSKAGATLTASAASGNPGVYISGVSGTSRLVRYQTAGSNRWLVGASSDAESGTNAGSNYVIYAYDDAGASLGAKLTITRSTGAFSITGDVSIAKSNAMMTINSSSNATPAYFRVFRDAGQFGGMSINTGSTSRWLVAGNNTAEAGSDAGSDFIIRRYSDAGGSLGDALTITRSTGNATFSGTVTAPTFTPSTSINLVAVADTATAATHYYVETATDGLIRPKTLADVKTEVVTNAAVNSAAATTVGTVTSGTWQGTAINATYIDSAIARLASPTFTGTVTTPGVKRNVVTKSALYTLTASDHIVIATSGTWTATLPTAASIAGTEYIIKNSGSGIITVDPAGTETIDGSTTIDLAKYDSLTVVSDGTNWVIV